MKISTMRSALPGGLLLLAVASAFSWPVVISAQTEPPRGSGPRTLAMSPGTCLTVADGDTITLDWYPGLETSEVRGMRHFEMSFAREEDRARAARLGAPLRLEASPRAHGEVPGQLNPEIEDAGNGMFHIRFHPDLRNIEPGEYHLMGARAFAHVSGPAPSADTAMANSPTRSFFCLNVVAAQVPRRR